MGKKEQLKKWPQLPKRPMDFWLGGVHWHFANSSKLRLKTIHIHALRDILQMLQYEHPDTSARALLLTVDSQNVKHYQLARRLLNLIPKSAHFTFDVGETKVLDETELLVKGLPRSSQQLDLIVQSLQDLEMDQTKIELADSLVKDSKQKNKFRPFLKFKRRFPESNMLVIVTAKALHDGALWKLGQIVLKDIFGVAAGRTWLITAQQHMERHFTKNWSAADGVDRQHPLYISEDDRPRSRASSVPSVGRRQSIEEHSTGQLDSVDEDEDEDEDEADDYYQEEERPHAPNDANLVTTARNVVTYLWQVSPQERALQQRYFGLSNMTELVYCRNCCQRGHTAETCPAIQMSLPPKCGRCRQRGHHSTVCTNASVPAGGLLDNCDLCKGLGHAESECSYLWHSYRPHDGQVRKTDLLVYCYRCGSQGHWGADCQGGTTNGIPTPFSAKHAQIFTSTLLVHGSGSDKESDEDMGGVSLQPWQAAQLSNYA